MGQWHAGIVPRDNSSGNRAQHGSVGRNGNAHRRRVVVEVDWAYQHPPWVGDLPKIRQKRLCQEMINIARMVQQRRCGRYKILINSGMTKSRAWSRRQIFNIACPQLWR